MSLAKNKVEWCLRKAEKELKEKKKHRGLVKIDSTQTEANEHITKAEHYLGATIYLKNGGFSDLCASTIFYATYHALLAIAVKHGYESRNQECTFALIYYLIEENKIQMNKNLLEKVAKLNPEEHNEKTAIGVREFYQYGTSLSIEENLYGDLLETAKAIIMEAKIIVGKK